MRIIAFGDVHMTAHMCRHIPDIGSADLLLATGDLTNCGRKKDARQVLDELRAINPNILALIGNLDNFEINDYLEQLDLNLHGQARLVQDRICIFGVGGSNRTPFHTPTEFTENTLTEILMRGYHQGMEYISRAAPFNRCRLPMILIAHAPPRDTKVDRLASGRHVGSAAVRSFIENYQPDLCITGHIHEARGEDVIGNTRIINPGMLQQGGWVDISLNNSILHATLK